mgnify:CR=1 FL=1|tara:strand:+ start:1811 stop:2146 length:336 start_codon:yes stop_codon:yes gene_type:complete
MKYEPIKTEFTYGGDTLKQVHRDGLYAVYSRTTESGITQYEIIIIQLEHAREFGGKKYPNREVYPSPSKWGTFGWTITKCTEEYAVIFMQTKRRLKEVKFKAVRTRKRKAK